MGTLLQVKGLRTQFFTQDGVVNAVNGITYDLNEGETLGLVGESGCGKSVSVLSLMLLIPQPPGRVVGGEAWFQGRNLLTMDGEEIRSVRGNKIAMIFQDPMTSLNPVLTINQQVSEALELHLGMDKKQARQRTIELLELVRIPDAANRIDDYPHQFSGGMRQRVMIAMGLSCNPQLLIADEPTTALDVTIQAQIIDLVRQLKDEIGMAVVWITHDLGVVAGLADRVNVMYAGYIIESDEARKRTLTPIEGLPPDLIEMPSGCPFAPRCVYAIERCLNENPMLETVSRGHTVACWVDVSGGRK
jgi:oligopeptide transport system ATP-binding protein